MAETLHGLEWKLKCLACMVSITHVKALKQVASYGISHEPPWLKQEKAKPSMLSNSPIFSRLSLLQLANSLQINTIS